MKQICRIDNCGGHVRARGLCWKHYMRWNRHGDPFRSDVEHGKTNRFLQDVVLQHQSDECLHWPFFRMENGYGQIRRNDRAVLAHRLVCELVHGPAPTPDHEAAHSCGKGHEGCVNPNHLRWATHKENEEDKIAHGTLLRGEAISKLTEDDVRKIRALKGTMSQREIAEMFGVWQTNISHILRGKSWGWLK